MAPTYPLSSAMRQKAKLEEEEKDRVKEAKEAAKLARREAKRAAKEAAGGIGDETVTKEEETEAMHGDQVDEEGDNKPGMLRCPKSLSHSRSDQLTLCEAGLSEMEAATQKSNMIDLAKRFEESYDSEQSLRASEVANAEQMIINKTVLAALLKERLEIGEVMWVIFQRLRCIL